METHDRQIYYANICLLMTDLTWTHLFYMTEGALLIEMFQIDEI